METWDDVGPELLAALGEAKVALVHPYASEWFKKKAVQKIDAAIARAEKIGKPEE